MRKLVAVLLFCFASAANAQVSSSYFGMGINKDTTPWPKFPFGTGRIWDATDGGSGRAHWKGTETSRGVYSWSIIDSYVSQFQAAGNANIIYTFGYVPAWANGSAGDAAPPTLPQDFYDFVTAIATRYTGRITAYEVWNEPSSSTFWTGSVATQVAYAQNVQTIVHGIDPTAKVLCPANDGPAGLVWINTFLSLGGGAYCDVYAFHAYPWQSPPEPPEGLANIIAQYGYAAQANSVILPWWITEFDSNATGSAGNPVSLAVYYIIANSLGVSSLDWYQYDNTTYGYLQGSNQGLNAAGAAYRVMYSWLYGATWTSAPARQTKTNGVRNPTLTGAVAGTPGTPPTNMIVNNGDATLLTTIVGTGTVSGVNYLDWRVHGTPTGTDAVSFRFESPTQIAASLGQFWTAGLNVSLVGGSLANTTVDIAFLETNTGGSGLKEDAIQTFVPNALSVATQAYWTYAIATSNASIVHVYPLLEVNYTAGQAVDVTLRIALPFMDNGTQWLGTLTRNNGASSVITWDVANQANGAINYTTTNACGGSTCGYWRDISNSIHSVSGTTVLLSNSPIILDTAAQAVRF